MPDAWICRALCDSDSGLSSVDMLSRRLTTSATQYTHIVVDRLTAVLGAEISGLSFLSFSAAYLALAPSHNLASAKCHLTQPAWIFQASI